MNLFKIVVYGLLAPYTKCGPRHRGKPLWVDVLIALLARPKAAFLDTADHAGADPEGAVEERFGAAARFLRLRDAQPSMALELRLASAR